MDLFLAQKAALTQSILCRDVPRSKIHQILESSALKRSEHIMDMASLNIKSAVPIWRILILDNDSSKIVSKLFTKSELLDLGVTLTLGISTEKDKVEDLVAVYICSSTENNLKQISKDISLKLYSKYSVSFLDLKEEDVLEQFQRQLSEAAIKSSNIQSKDNKFGDILSINSINCHYNGLQADLFSLSDDQNTEIDMAYYNFLKVSNETVKADEKTEIENKSEYIAQKLFNQMTTLYLNGKSSLVPVLCKPKSSTYFVDRIFAKLKTKIQSFFKVSSNNRYYLFVIEERINDITPFFTNSSTYQAMVFDYLQVKNNFLTLEDGNRAFITDEDMFWRVYKDKHFQEVVEGLRKEVKEYTDKSNNVLSTSKNDMHLDTEEIQAIKAQKKSIDMHSFQLEKLTEVLKQKGIIDLVNAEEDIIGKSLNKDEIDKILTGEKFSENELSKLCFLLYLQDYEDFKKDRDDGHFLKCLDKIKLYKDVKNILMSSKDSKGKKSFIEQIASKVTQTTSRIMKSLINTNLKFELNKRFVELLENSEYEKSNYEVFSVNNGEDSYYSRGVLFVMGGGNVNEVNELESFVKSLNEDNKLDIIYGCSSIYNSNEWISKFVRDN
eukprot:GAHX01001314.1.p1 GENE.GAHX01001314.1~~GAHX01001314.1.p1  ORF type:complete len:609 (+),score=146.73 GAHX01001314.1:590-2416(+)